MFASGQGVLLSLGLSSFFNSWVESKFKRLKIVMPRIIGSGNGLRVNQKFSLEAHCEKRKIIRKLKVKNYEIFQQYTRFFFFS